MKPKKNKKIEKKSPPKITKELNRLVLTSLKKSQENMNGTNQYRMNDIGLGYLPNIIESISYPQFVLDDKKKLGINKPYGKKSKVLKPLTKEWDVNSKWINKIGNDFLKHISV